MSNIYEINNDEREVKQVFFVQGGGGGGGVMKDSIRGEGFWCNGDLAKLLTYNDLSFHISCDNQGKSASTARKVGFTYVCQCGKSIVNSNLHL